MVPHAGISSDQDRGYFTPKLTPNPAKRLGLFIMDTFEAKPHILFILAALTGFLLGLCAGVIAWLAGWGAPWAWFIASWVFSTAVTWLALLGRVLRVAEAVLGVDLDRDGVIGDPNRIRLQPAEVSPTTRIDLIDERDGYQVQRAELPIDPERLALVSYQVQHGAPFSHGLAGAGKPLSRSQYESLRDYMLSRSWLTWRNPYSPKDGLELTLAGRSVVRHYASMIEDLPRLEG